MHRRKHSIYGFDPSKVWLIIDLLRRKQIFFLFFQLFFNSSFLKNGAMYNSGSFTVDLDQLLERDTDKVLKYSILRAYQTMKTTSGSRTWYSSSTAHSLMIWPASESIRVLLYYYLENLLLFLFSAPRKLWNPAWAVWWLLHAWILRDSRRCMERIRWGICIASQDEPELKSECIGRHFGRLFSTKCLSSLFSHSIAQFSGWSVPLFWLLHLRKYDLSEQGLWVFLTVVYLFW